MKRILAAIAIIATALFLLAAAAPAAAPESSMQPAASVSNYTPAPTMNTNVTWLSFHNGWKPLEYSNGTGNQTLAANPSGFYTNPISVNPVDLQSTYLTNSNATGTPFNSSHLATLTSSSTNGGAVQTASYANGIYTLTDNTSAADSNTGQWYLPGYISDTLLPSNNMAFDYVTVAFSLSGQSMTGVSAYLVIWNSTAPQAGIVPNTTIYPGQSIWESAPLSDFKGENFNTTVSSKLILDLELNLPVHSSTTYTIKLSALTITTAPLYLGNNASGTEHISINPKFSTFNPDFPWTSVTNNGYSVAISQSMQNTTEQQTSINDGSFSEQATYQGIFELPTAPDLTYQAANISVALTIPGTQYEVANLNGISYLSSIQTHSNGTFTFSTVNPNSQNSLVIEVKYTTAQWDASSAPPSFFSLAGLEYYWWATLIAIMSFVGLGSAALSHFGANEEGLRIPKGKFGR